VPDAAPVVLLFASALRTGADYEPALRERGYEVLRAATTRSLERCMRDAVVDLVLLDSASASDVERAIKVLNSAGRPIPRLWVSASSDAPSRSGHLGVDALLIDPDDVVGVLASVARFLRPHGSIETPHPFMADGTNPPRGRVRGTGPVKPKAKGSEPDVAPEPDPSSSWEDPTNDWKIKPR
jgi:hypothetical protein